jgi:8-oxo-dGTP pyrophosphatase MutT (NUDIX family)
MQNNHHHHPNQYQKLSRPHTCRNCGIVGHLYKDCPHPIMSFGLICYRQKPAAAAVEYLMIQRRDSLSFMEFIRGKYDLQNLTYIQHLLYFMTQDERRMLMAHTFPELWKHVWIQVSNHSQRYSQEYNESRSKFQALLNGYTTVDGNFVMLRDIICSVTSKFKEPEWGFPKGRRRLKEEDIDCAVREFCEETGFTPNDIVLEGNVPPFEEVFYGTNNVLYRHVYYVARFVGEQDTGADEIVIDPNNMHQSREVRQVKWLSAPDVLTRIRAHNVERRNLFKEVHARLSMSESHQGLPSPQLTMLKPVSFYGTHKICG